MRGDHHRRSQPVEFDEQARQPPRKRRVNVSGGLVGQQQFGLLDQGARDCRALLFTARQHRRQHMHALAKADPFQQLGHVAAVACLLAPAHAQRQRDVLVGRHVIEKAEVLEHHADATAHQRQFLRRYTRAVLAEDGDQPARRLQRQEQKPQQGGLAGAGGASQELERAFGNVQGNVAENFRAHPVAQADVLEADQMQSPWVLGPPKRAECSRRPSGRRVNDRLNFTAKAGLIRCLVGKH